MIGTISFWDILITAGVAAAPWGEVLAAVPLGAYLGLPLFLAFTLAVMANLVPVMILAFIGERFAARRPSVSGSPRRKRAEAFFGRYGVVGLSFIAPLITGVYVSTIVMTYFHVPRAKIILWSALGITAWGLLMTGATALGIKIFT